MSTPLELRGLQDLGVLRIGNLLLSHHDSGGIPDEIYGKKNVSRKKFIRLRWRGRVFIFGRMRRRFKQQPDHGQCHGDGNANPDAVSRANSATNRTANGQTNGAADGTTNRDQHESDCQSSSLYGLR